MNLPDNFLAEVHTIIFYEIVGAVEFILICYLML